MLIFYNSFPSYLSQTHSHSDVQFITKLFPSDPYELRAAESKGQLDLSSFLCLLLQSLLFVLATYYRSVSQYPLFESLLFSIYSYFLGDHIQFHGFKCHRYANDTQTDIPSLDFPLTPDSCI